ncbi:MAG: hypothetical protein AAGD07_17590 [Planctomycetota bacterium]
MKRACWLACISQFLLGTSIFVARLTYAQDDMRQAAHASTDRDGGSVDGLTSDGPDGDAPPDHAESPTRVSFGPAGVQRFSPGGWSALSVAGVNPSDHDTEEVVSFSIADDPSLQYSRRFWLPAESKRICWLPIQVPPDVPQQGPTLPLSMIRIHDRDGRESLAENLNGEPVQERSVMLTPTEVNTALVVNSADLVLPPVSPDRPLDAVRSAEDELVKLILAARDQVIQTPQYLPLIALRSPFIAPSHESLHELDQLIIAGDHLREDTTGIESVRQWVHRGGRLWIMLDRAAPDLVEELIGHQVGFTEIDRIELNEFEFQFADRQPTPSDQTESWSSETPATLIRGIADVDEVALRINGWPAAMWQQVGRGEVLLTTLDSRGWLHADRRPTLAMLQIAGRFFETRDYPLQHTAWMKPILESEIGYEIPDRRLAGAVLSANAATVFLTGVWWMRRRRLERMAVLIPISAVLTAGTLFWIGSRQTASVPSTVATGQIVEVLRGDDRLSVSSLHAVYTQDEDAQRLSSSGATLIQPEYQPTGETRRVRWDDSGHSRWLGNSQPPGVVRPYQSSTIQPAHPPIRVRGSFDSSGFCGNITGLDPLACEDVVAFAKTGVRSAVSVDATDPQGALRCRVGDLLPKNRFVAGSLVSDEQRLRQGLLQNLFADRLSPPFGNESGLLLWTKPFPTDVEATPSFQTRGMALVSIPIEFVRPAPGTEFVVPATFIHTGLATDEGGFSLAYNPQTGEWLDDLTEGQVTDLLFTFPESLQGMDLQRVDVNIKITAPQRTLIIQCQQEGSLQPVYESYSPTGNVRFAIERPEWLQQRAEGGWWMQVGVTGRNQQTEQSANGPAGDGSFAVDRMPPNALPSQEKENATWTIESVSISVVGRIEAS